MNKVITIIALFYLIGCTSKKPMTETNNDNLSTCKTSATVVDMTGLDGCRYLLEVENKEKWLPLKMSDPNFKFHAGQKVQFDYEEVEDYMSICMAENKGINITCIKEVASAQLLPDACTGIPQLLKTEWIQKITKEKAIRKLTRYQDQPQLAYYYFESRTNGYLYDCNGKMICDIDKQTPNSDCADKIGKLKDGQVIWVLNN